MGTVEVRDRLGDEDQLRARLYAFLSHLLAGPPDGQFLDALRRLEGDDSPIGAALAALGAAASATSVEQAEREFADLFIGITGGEVVPYASHHLTGFLYDRPLAQLRDDLAMLGIEQADDVAEPEDHIASLLEVLEGLITGRFGEAATLESQKRFFDAHLGSWAARFFDDLERAPSAHLYREVARLGRRFLAVEAEAFGMI